ncbi:hypothetical protein HanPI659440_Chr16g0644851 [Helianthus annuus]|nr:hypothetical protein HanPI659440_Chr16g0644851 [Helianthus annuus]
MYDQVVRDNRQAASAGDGGGDGFVCELNDVEISIDDLAGQLNVAVATCKLRYKELLKCLVDVARANLPWGDDVNVKNIMINA